MLSFAFPLTKIGIIDYRHMLLDYWAITWQGLSGINGLPTAYCSLDLLIFPEFRHLYKVHIIFPQQAVQSRNFGVYQYQNFTEHGEHFLQDFL